MLPVHLPSPNGRFCHGYARGRPAAVRSPRYVSTRSSIARRLDPNRVGEGWQKTTLQLSLFLSFPPLRFPARLSAKRNRRAPLDSVLISPCMARMHAGKKKSKEGEEEKEQQPQLVPAPPFRLPSPAQKDKKIRLTPPGLEPGPPAISRSVCFHGITPAWQAEILPLNHGVFRGDFRANNGV